MTLTKAIIYAISQDAAERSKRARGLSVMDDTANDAYHAEFDRLFSLIGGPEGWMELQRQ